MRKINAVVWHYSDSRDVSAGIIDQWHKARGWKGIGYHGVIRRDGTFEPGRPENTAGAHVEGHNSNTIGYCLTGSSREKWYPTDAQYVTAARLAQGAMSKYGLTVEQATKFHRDYMATSCPGPLDRVRLQSAIKPRPEGGEMAIASLQGDIGPDKTWGTAGYVGPGAKVYVDAVNNSGKDATLEVNVQLLDTGNYGRRRIVVSASKARQAGFTVFEVGHLFSNAAMGNFSISFSANQPMTIKTTQELR